MLRTFVLPLLGAFVAARSTSGRHSRLTSAGLALLAARLGGAGVVGLAGVLLGVLMQGRANAVDPTPVPAQAGTSRRRLG